MPEYSHGHVRLQLVADAKDIQAFAILKGAVIDAAHNAPANGIFALFKTA